jgi:hypothetical protein
MVVKAVGMKVPARKMAISDNMVKNATCRIDQFARAGTCWLLLLASMVYFDLLWEEPYTLKEKHCCGRHENWSAVEVIPERTSIYPILPIPLTMQVLRRLLMLIRDSRLISPGRVLESSHIHIQSSSACSTLAAAASALVVVAKLTISQVTLINY